MSMTDPISDLLTRIRNAHLSKHDRLDVPSSKLKLEVVYKRATEIQPVRNGLGVGIVSTSLGLLTDRQARERRVGGELLCEVW